MCDNPRGEVAEGEEESEEAREGRARLQRMKVQSRRTFKFRKTRKRERQEGGTVATIGGEIVPVVPPPKVTIRHIHNIKSHQNPHYMTPYPNPTAGEEHEHDGGGAAARQAGEEARP